MRLIVRIMNWWTINATWQDWLMIFYRKNELVKSTITFLNTFCSCSFSFICSMFKFSFVNSDTCIETELFHAWIFNTMKYFQSIFSITKTILYPRRYNNIDSPDVLYRYGILYIFKIQYQHKEHKTANFSKLHVL